MEPIPAVDCLFVIHREREVGSHPPKEMGIVRKIRGYRVIQRSVPPSTAKLGNAVKNPRAYLNNIGKNTLFANKKQILTSNFQDFRAFRNDAPMSRV